MKTTWKLHMALVLMLAAVLAVAIPALAADDEKHTVSGKFEINNEAPKDPFSFSLYKVGSIGQQDGKATLELDEKVKKAIPTKVNLDIDKNDYDTDTEEGQKEWENAWLEQGKIVAEYLPDDTPKAADDVTTDSNGAFKFSPVPGNSLYLLVGKTVYTEPEKDENGCAVIWSPQPMLVLVLNEDVDLIVKPLKETIPPKYTVIKSWQDTGYEKKRPNEIKVEIYYDYKTGEKNTPVETVALNASNNWCYSWSTENEKYADKTGNKYTVKEVLTSDLKKTYTVKESESVDEKNNTKRFNITNVYNSSSKSSSSKVKTGDQGGMWKYYLLGAAALMVLIAVFIRLRSKKDS